MDRGRFSVTHVIAAKIGTASGNELIILFVRHLKSFILPIGVLVIIPVILLSVISPIHPLLGINIFNLSVQIVLAAIMGGSGLFLLIICIQLFARLGKGTLAPWDPTGKLVIAGPYRYSRNPMISGVFLVLCAEAIALGSLSILIWSFLIFVINHIYFVYFEEPALAQRFGNEYIEYKANVPRWMPRSQSRL